MLNTLSVIRIWFKCPKCFLSASSDKREKNMQCNLKYGSVIALC